MTRPVTRWTVVIDIHEVDGAIRAVARLHDRTSDRLVGDVSLMSVRSSASRRLRRRR
jgi:hypothetical protein